MLNDGCPANLYKNKVCLNVEYDQEFSFEICVFSLIEDLGKIENYIDL